MKLKQYLNEMISHSERRKQTKQYGKEIETARKALAKKHRVDPEFLEFAFVWDMAEYGKTVNFHIMDPKHKKYKSTVAEIF